jgi:hypothetical protein
MILKQIFNGVLGRQRALLEAAMELCSGGRGMFYFGGGPKMMWQILGSHF